MGKLFGTDGVRGIANKELTCEMAFKIGQAGAFVLTDARHKKPTIYIGKDTRISGDMLEAALIAGICSVGANVHLLGVAPTPAVAYLTKKHGADAGVVISASHNPMEHNGIKFFSSEGFKLSDELEEKIEEILLNPGFPFPEKIGGEIGRVSRDEDAVNEYVDFLASLLPEGLNGMRIAVDCANGAASATAGALFEKVGAKADIFFAEPDGTNINDGCGSTHLGKLCEIVKNGGYALGVAFDGDADRCLLVDENGEPIDGDRIIAACALHLKEQGKLLNDAVAVTVLTNMGFFEMAKNNGITPLVTKVGDRYVLEEMQKSGAVLGGEQSGHIIFLDHNTTGDGQITALQFLAVLKESGKKASEAAAVMQVYPQVMLNVKVKSNEAKSLWEQDADIIRQIKRVEKILGNEGRILVRPSGTEALIRVMLEGKSTGQITKLAEDVAGTIEQKFGI